MTRFICCILVLASAFGSTLAAQDAGDPVRGLAYAKTSCASCHAVDPNEDVPAIDGAPSFDQVANTPGMTSTALAVWLQTPHPNMPNFIIPSPDMDDVISYILTLKKAK